MARVQSVLCPVDFSEHSRRALEYAVALAAYHHARLTVLSVIDPLLAQAAAVHCDPDYLHESKAELHAFVGETSLEANSWAPTPRLVVTIGHPGDQVLAVARLHEADLIVMGTQGLGGLRKFVFGSTTDRVLRRAEVPVLAVPLGGPSLVSLGREGPAFGIQRVIGAIDLRPGSLALARMAAGVARDFHASLLLMHVVPAVQATSRWRTSCEEATSLHVQTAVAGIEDIAQRLGAAPPVDTVVTAGHPADAITQLAVQRHAQLIVIGTGTGENGANRPGSTAYRVLCASAVPVLAVPPVSARRVDADRESTTSQAPLEAPDAPGRTSVTSTKGRHDTERCRELSAARLPGGVAPVATNTTARTHDLPAAPRSRRRTRQPQRLRDERSRRSFKPRRYSRDRASGPVAAPATLLILAVPGSGCQVPGEVPGSTFRVLVPSSRFGCQFQVRVLVPGSGCYPI